MQYTAPLIQTILWVALIGAVLWRFNKPLYGLLSALQKRVEAGSSIKAGPFELIDTLRPADPVKQREKIDAELIEAAQSSGVSDAEVVSPRSPPSSNLRAKYFEAEDLALRAVQAEFRAPITREITGGADSGFDGVFAADGRLNIVEVKYLRDASAASSLSASVSRVAKAIEQYDWPLVRLILVVVIERVERVADAELEILRALPDVNLSIVVRVFSLKALQKRFGIERVDA